jgi:hypothetical protein
MSSSTGNALENLWLKSYTRPQYAVFARGPELLALNSKLFLLLEFVHIILKVKQ